MASTNKTETLGLNQWIGSDKPKMEDFNSDNRLIDTALAGHRADQTVHVSAQERRTGGTPDYLGVSAALWNGIRCG